MRSRDRSVRESGGHAAAHGRDAGPGPWLLRRSCWQRDAGDAPAKRRRGAAGESFRPGELAGGGCASCGGHVPRDT